MIFIITIPYLFFIYIVVFYQLKIFSYFVVIIFDKTIIVQMFVYSLLMYYWILQEG